MSALDVTDADDIMQRFDADGSGNLDEKEISAMKSYIEDKKNVLSSQRMAASEQKSKVDLDRNATSPKNQPVVILHNADKASTSEVVGDFVSQIAFKNVSVL
jgi:hypothetical protein